MGIADPQDPGVSEVWNIEGGGLTRVSNRFGADTETGLSPELSCVDNCISAGKDVECEDNDCAPVRDVITASPS